jgi:hypothetical protein
MSKSIKFPNKEEILYEYVKRAILEGKYGVIFTITAIEEKTNSRCTVWASLSIYYKVINRLYADGALRAFPLGENRYVYASEEYAAIYLTKTKKGK